MAHVHRQAPLANHRRFSAPNRAIAEVALCDRQHWQAASFAFVALTLGLYTVDNPEFAETIHVQSSMKSMTGTQPA